MIQVFVVYPPTQENLVQTLDPGVYRTKLRFKMNLKLSSKGDRPPQPILGDYCCKKNCL